MNLAALLIAAASTLTPASQQQQQPMPLKDYKRAQAPGYVVLAPSQAEADKYAQQVQYAIDQFEKYFREAPPPVTVLIAESPQALSLPEVSQLAAPGRPFLPFLTEQKLAAARKAAGDLYMLDAGAALTEREGEITVLNAFALPAKKRVELEAGDIILELNGQEVIGLAAFKEQYASIAIGEEVELFVQRGNEVVTVRYLRQEPAARVQVQPLAAAGDAIKLAQMRPLSHEVGHVLLISLADKLLRENGAEDSAAPDRPVEQIPVGQHSMPRIHSYGHRKLPDWLDEAAATLAEVPELRQQRNAFLKAHLERRIPLAELLAMEHPMLGLAANLAPQNGQQAPVPRVASIRIEDAGGVLQNASIFYAQVQSFAEFLEERGGAGTLRHVLDAVLAGQTTADSLSGVNGLPEDLSALETQWESRTRQGKSCPGCVTGPPRGLHPRRSVEVFRLTVESSRAVVYMPLRDFSAGSGRQGLPSQR